MTYLHDRNVHYFGHQARLLNESKRIVAVMDDLEQNPHKVYFDFDYAMRLLPMSYRENMVDFFGKKGISWHGVRAVWWDPVIRMHRYYLVNQISPDCKEDGQLSCSLIANVLRQHREQYPQHTVCNFGSDGAGAFSGDTFLLRIVYIFSELGMKVDAHHTGESGGGKGMVDVNFGVEKNELLKQVLRGQGAQDIVDADSAVMVLNARPKAYTVAYKAESERNALKPGGKKISGLQSAAYRVIIYNDITRLPERIDCYLQSGLNRKPDFSIKMDGRWLATVSPTQIVNAATGGCLLPSGDHSLVSTVAESAATVVVDLSVGISGSISSSGRSGGGIGSTSSGDSDRAVSSSGGDVSIVDGAAETVLKTAATLNTRSMNKVEKARKLAAYQARQKRKHQELVDNAPIIAWLCCPEVGCIRQCTSYARLQQHYIANNCQSSGQPFVRSSVPVAPHECDKLSIKDMAIKWMTERYTEADSNRDIRSDEDAGNSFVAQSLHAEASTASARMDKPITCKFIAQASLPPEVDDSAKNVLRMVLAIRRKGRPYQDFFCRGCPSYARYRLGAERSRAHMVPSTRRRPTGKIERLKQKVSDFSTTIAKRAF